MSLSVPERKKYITNRLIQLGYTPVQTAAIVGNLQAENDTFDPSRREDGGGPGIGIAQWTDKPRKDGLLALQNPYDIDSQIEYLHQEIQGKMPVWTNNAGGKNAFFNTTDLNQATYIFRKDFERPSEKYARDDKRTKHASEAMSLIDPNYKFTPQQANDRKITEGLSSTFNHRPELSEADIWEIYNNQPSVFEEFNKVREEIEKEKQNEAKQNQKEDIQRQQLLAAQQQKEQFMSLLTEQSNPNELYNNTIAQIPPQQPQSPFRFQSDWFSPQMAQEGGEIELPTATVNPLQASNKFLIDYINSPNYRQRLTNSGYKDVENVIQQRSDNVADVKLKKIQYERPGFFERIKMSLYGEPYTTVGSVYNGKDNSIILDQQESEFLEVPLTDVWTHETGHSELNPVPINEYDKKVITDRLIIDPYTNLHGSNPKEIKSDLNVLRYHLYKNNIVDPKTQQIKKEDLDKLDSSFIKERLLETVGEENLIWLLNNIALNTPNTTNQYTA